MYGKMIIYHYIWWNRHTQVKFHVILIGFSSLFHYLYVLIKRPWAKIFFRCLVVRNCNSSGLSFLFKTEDSSLFKTDFWKIYNTTGYDDDSYILHHHYRFSFSWHHSQYFKSGKNSTRNTPQNISQRMCHEKCISFYKQFGSRFKEL